MTTEHLDEMLAGRTRRSALQMAAEQTELALIRTGFSMAAFGAGMTQLVGRGIWPDSVVDALIIVFVLSGIVGVQSGLIRLMKRMDKSGHTDTSGRVGHYLRFAAFCLLQIALVAIIVMTLLHSVWVGS